MFNFTRFVYYSVEDMRDLLASDHALGILYPVEIYSAFADIARHYAFNLDTEGIFELPSVSSRNDVCEEILASARRHRVTVSAVPEGYSFAAMLSDVHAVDDDAGWI